MGIGFTPAEDAFRREVRAFLRDRLPPRTAARVLSFEALGAMAAARDATLDHLRTRVQFGAPIGASQILRHRMDTVGIEIEQARSAAINAAAALDGERHARERAASARWSPRKPSRCTAAWA